MKHFRAIPAVNTVVQVRGNIAPVTESAAPLFLAPRIAQTNHVDLFAVEHSEQARARQRDGFHGWLKATQVHVEQL